MKKDKVMAILRHSLTFVGGILVIKGGHDEAIVEEIVGGLMTVIGLVWSLVDKSGEKKEEEKTDVD